MPVSYSQFSVTQYLVSQSAATRQGGFLEFNIIVYQLYDLTDGEIARIEETTK